MHQTRLKYGAPQTLPITLTSLASSALAGRASGAVAGAADGFADVLVQVRAVLPVGAPTGDKAVFVYAYASLDGTVFVDDVTGTDGALTLRDPTNLALVGRLDCPDSGGLTWRSQLFSLAAVWQGTLPPHWGLFVRNATGLALAAGSDVRYVSVATELRRVA